MATTTKTRASRNLKPEAVIAAEAAIATQAAARESNSAAIAAAIQAVIDGYQATVEAVQTAEQARLTKLEQTYVALSDVAAKYELDYAMSQDLLTKALGAYYPAADFKIAVSTASKLRSQLLRAMHPNVRGKLAAIVKPWEDAWDRETAAKAADPQAATPLRDKFDNRGGTITQALKLAMGKTDSKGKITVAPEVKATADDVLSWVSAHPRQKRGTPAAAPKAPTPDKLPESATPRQIAEAEVTALINAVNEVGSKYPAATALFADVLAALRKCTSDRLLPSNGDKPTEAPAASEPVSGVVDLDALLDAKLEAALSRLASRGK